MREINLILIIGALCASAAAGAASGHDLDCALRLQAIAFDGLTEKAGASDGRLPTIRVGDVSVAFDQQRRAVVAFGGGKVLANLEGENNFYLGSISPGSPILARAPGNAYACYQIIGGDLSVTDSLSPCAKKGAPLERAANGDSKAASVWSEVMDRALFGQDALVRVGTADDGRTLDSHDKRIAELFQRKPESVTAYFNLIRRFADQAEACFDSSEEVFGRGRWLDEANRLRSQIRSALAPR